MTYQEWIHANVVEPYGKCAEATTAMVEAFPELRRVRGHYLDAFWGERAHWWLVTADGTVVDPTHAQFPDIGGAYVPWTEGANEPTGQCMNCGGYCYNSEPACSAACQASLSAYYGVAFS